MNTVQLTLHTISHHFPAQNFIKISVTFGLHKAIVWGQAIIHKERVKKSLKSQWTRKNGSKKKLYFRLKLVAFVFLKYKNEDNKKY